MMKATTIVLLLSAVTLSTAPLKDDYIREGLESGFIGKDDVVSFDIARAFVLSLFKHPIKVTASKNVRISDYWTPVSSFDYPTNLETASNQEPEGEKVFFTKKIGQNSSVTVLEGDKVFWTEVDGDSAKVTNSRKWKVSPIGHHFECTDAATYDLPDGTDTILYVACHSDLQGGKSPLPSTVNIVAFSIKSGNQILSKASFNNNKSTIIKNRAILQVIQIPSLNKKTTPAVVLYDQGSSHQQETVQFQVTPDLYTFRIVAKQGYLEHLTSDITFSPASGTFQITYDHFYWNEGFIVTGVVKKPSGTSSSGSEEPLTVSYHYCKVDPVDQTSGSHVNCTVSVDSKVPAGQLYAKFQGDSNKDLVEFNYETKTLQYFTVSDQMSAQDWKTLKKTDISVSIDPNVSEGHSWVRNFEGDLNGGMLYFSDNTKQDSGITVLSSKTSFATSWYFPNASGYYQADFYMVFESTKFSLYRETPFSMFVDANDLNEGPNKIEVTVTGGDKISKTLTTYLMKVSDPMSVDIEAIKDSAFLTSLFPKKSTQLGFTGLNLWQGNNISVESVSVTGADNKTSNNLNTEVVTFGQVSIEMTNGSEMPKFDAVSAGLGYVIGQKDNKLHFNFCELPGPKKYICEETSVLEIPSSTTLHTKSENVASTLLGYYVDAKQESATLFAYTVKSGKLITQPLNFVPTDVGFTSDPKTNHPWMAVAQNKDGTVPSVITYQFDPTDNTFKQQNEIKSDPEGPFGTFCPQQVQFSPQQRTLLHIYSFCFKEEEAASILSYELAHYLTTATKVDLPTKAGDQRFCAMGEEFIIFSPGQTSEGQKPVLYAVDTFSSISKYHFDLNGTDLENAKALICIPRPLQQFAIVANAEEGQKNLGVFYGNRRFNINRRISHIETGLDQTKWANNLVHGFGIGMETLFFNSAGEAFSLPYEGFRIEATFAQGDVDSDELLSVDVTLKAGSKTLTTPAAQVLTRQEFSDVSVVFRKDKKLPSGTQGLVDLEEYSEIVGPVKEIGIDADASEIDVMQRTTDGPAFSTDVQDRFDMFRGSYSEGFALTIATEDANKLYHFQDGKIVGKTSSLPDAIAFDFARGPSGKSYVVPHIAYRGPSSTSNTLAVAFINGDDTTIATKQFFGAFSKVRILRSSKSLPPSSGTPAPQSYLLMATDSGSLRFFVVSVAESSSGTASIDIRTANNIEAHAGIIDFDYTVFGNTALVYFTQRGSGEFGSIEVNALTFEGTTRKSIQPSETKYQLSSIAATGLDKDTNKVVINTVGTQIIDMVVSIAAPKESESPIMKMTLFDKVGDFDGSLIYLTEKYVALYASSMSDLTQSQVIVWKSRTLSDSDKAPVDPTFFSLIPVNNKIKSRQAMSPAKLIAHSASPDLSLKTALVYNQGFILAEDADGNSTVLLSDAQGDKRVSTYNVQPFTVNIKSTSANLVSARISLVQDQDHVTVTNLETIVTGENEPSSGTSSTSSGSDEPSGTGFGPAPQPSGSSSATGTGTGTGKPEGPVPIWPYLLIMGVLILAGIAWFIYVALKGEGESGNQNDSNYVSLNPGDTKFTDKMDGEDEEEDIGRGLN